MNSSSKLLSTAFLAGVLSAGTVAAEPVMQDTKQSVTTILDAPEWAGYDSTPFELSKLKPYAGQLKHDEDIILMGRTSYENKDAMHVQFGNYDAKLHKKLLAYIYNDVVMLEYSDINTLTQELPTGAFSIHPISE